MLIRLPESRLHEHERGRSPAFADAVRAAAKRDGADLLISSEDWIALTRKHWIKSNTPTPIEPSAAELAANFVGAMQRWQAAGFPVVTAEQYSDRKSACDACEFWDGAARLGLGKCKAPGCGCTKFKRWLATERCKHPAGSRWPALGA